jgi:hypothetical protein
VQFFLPILSSLFPFTMEQQLDHLHAALSAQFTDTLEGLRGRIKAVQQETASLRQGQQVQDHLLLARSQQSRLISRQRNSLIAYGMIARRRVSGSRRPIAVRSSSFRIWLLYCFTWAWLAVPFTVVIAHFFALASPFGI